MKTQFLAMLLLVMAQQAVSQVKITGTVTAIDGSPIPFVNVLIVNAVDSSFIKGAVTDELGNFNVENIEKGKYIMRLSSLTYKTWHSPLFELTGEQKEVNFGNHMMAEDIQELDVVTVVGDRPLFQQELDKTIINVQSSILTKGSTLMELLERSPGVTIDRQSSNIILNGKRGVGVMINGDLVRLPASDVVSMLNGMNADNIEKIEILTTPPAKYDAEGVGGLINIVVKKNEDDGTNGVVSLTGSYGLYAKSAASASLNHRKGPLNLYGNYSFAYDKTQWEIAARGTFRFPYEDEEVNRTSDYLNVNTVSKRMHNATIGFDYLIGTKTTLSASSMLSQTFQRSNGFTNCKYTIFGDSLQLFLIDSYDENNWKSAINNVNLERVLGRNGKINFDFDYLFHRNDNPSDYRNSFLDKNGSDIDGEGFVAEQHVQNKTPINIFVYRSDYEKTLSSTIKLQAGFKFSYSRIKNSVDLWDKDNDELTYREDVSYQLGMRESIKAGYSSVNFDFNKTRVDLGLRYEFTQTDVTYTSPGEPGFSRSYGNLFPSVFLTRKLSKASNFQLAYNRRISRPAFTAIAAPVRFFDIYGMAVGNPGLKPTITDNIKGQIQYKEAIFSLEFSRDKNQIVHNQITVGPSDRMAYLKSMNLKDQRSIWFQTSFPTKIAQWWKMQNTVLLGWKRFEAQGIVEENFTKALYALNVFSNQNFEFGRGYFLEISGYYYSADYNGSFKRKSFGAINAGIKKVFRHDRGSIQLAFPDVLKSTHYRLYLEPGLAPYDASHDDDIRPESRSAFMVKLTYTKSFGNNKIKSQRQRTAGASDEQGRLK